MRTTILCCVAFLGGCWADFPESRFAQDQRLPSSEQRDASPGLEQQPDRPVALEGSPREQAIADLPPAGDLPRDQGPADLPYDLPTVDQQKPDQLKPDQLKTDVGITCSPNTFIACANSNKDLHKCNLAGNGITVVVCGAANKCDAVLKRCTECDPLVPPTCQGSSLVTCSLDGLLVATSCPLGCNAGKCCVDLDKDGFSTCPAKLDCNDGNADVFPGQPDFFALPIPGGTSFDYDCSKLHEREFPDPVQCLLGTGICTGEGWALGPPVPACGQTGNWVTCVKDGPICKTVPATPPTKTQRCH